MNIPIDHSSVRRVAYRNGQLLDAADFAREQGFHLAARRRHNLAQHDWGIVEGLELRVTGRTVTLTPGLAVDGWGRELVVEQPKPVQSALIDRVGWDVDALAVCLVYGRRLVRDESERHERGDRWSEEPLVRDTELAAQEVPTAPDDRAAVAAHDVMGDRPHEPEWEVPLGVLVPSAGDRRVLTVAPAGRRLAGIVAHQIVAPDGSARMTLGDDETALRLTLGEEDAMTVDRSGDLRAAHDVAVGGIVRVDGGAVVFEERGETRAPTRGFLIYRVGNELRVDIPAGGRFTVGGRDDEDEFAEILTVDDEGVTVHGDLQVEGAVDAPKSFAEQVAAVAGPGAGAGTDAAAKAAQKMGIAAAAASVVTTLAIAVLLFLLVGKQMGWIK